MYREFVVPSIYHLNEKECLCKQRKGEIVEIVKGQQTETQMTCICLLPLCSICTACRDHEMFNVYIGTYIVAMSLYSPYIAVKKFSHM